MGYLVTLKVTRTANGKRMYFGTFIDRAGEFFDTVHFPPIVQSNPIYGKGIYRIVGIVAEEFGFYSIEVRSIKKLAYIEDPRFVVKAMSG